MQPDAPEMPAGLETALDAFMDASLREILHHEDPEAYFAALDALVARSGLGEWCDADMPFWSLGRWIWNATPLPSRGFRPVPLPEARRNDPCPCGSGKKFKRCCQPQVEAQPAPLDDTLPLILRAVSLFTGRQRRAAATEAPPIIRLALANQELEEDHPGKARDLLLPLLRGGGLDPADQAHATHLLGVAYMALGHLNAGEKAFHELLPSLKDLAATEALHWLAGQALEKGRADEAISLTLEADRRVPGHLVTGMLLVTCLRALGADEEAREAARQWLPIARELGDDEAIQLLEEQERLETLEDAEPGDFLQGHTEAEGDDSIAALFRTGDDSPLDELTRLLEQGAGRPLLPVRFDEGPADAEDGGQEYLLALPARVQRAESVLYQDLEGPDPLDPELLRTHPDLLQSLNFLERLEAEADDRGLPAPDFRAALKRQQHRLIEPILAALPAGGQLPWAWLEHRPLLRRLVDDALDHDDPQEAIPGLQRVLALCPDDNLGVRASLVDALLIAGRDEEALAVAERYPEDHLAETRYGRVLALVRLNRLHEAEQALAEAYQALPKVLNYLIAPQRKQPKFHPDGITLGGADQAWLYREQMRPVYAATPGMLSWLAKVKKRLPR